MDNAKIARGVMDELFNRGKLDFVDQNFEPGFRGHDTLLGEFGRDDLKRQVQMYRAAFPDLAVRIDELISAVDKVLLRWTTRGTNQGPFLGRPPNGRVLQVEGLTVLTFNNGKIAEEYTQWDALHLLQELGISPRLPSLSTPPPAH